MISTNTNGVDTVGAMVTFDGLKADKKGYRKFRIRTVEGQDATAHAGDAVPQIPPGDGR